MTHGGKKHHSKAYKGERWHSILQNRAGRRAVKKADRRHGRKLERGAAP